MQRKFESKTRGQLFVEQVVWNAAAGAALAVMVLLLLFSLHWLDQISLEVSADPRIGDTPVEIARPAVASDRNPIEPINRTHSITAQAREHQVLATEVAGVIGPGG